MIPLPGDPRKSTFNCKQFVGALNLQFPDCASMGIYNRRPIADSTRWSQHSWGNAVDITSPVGFVRPGLYASSAEAALPKYKAHMDYLDQVYRWLIANRVQLKIKYIAWRKYMHRNHIHVDFAPSMTGVPPILGPYNPEDEEDMKKGDEGPRVVVVQERLMKLGFELPQFGADGDYGDETVAAVKAFQAGLELEADGVLTALDMHRLFENATKDTYARKLARRAHERLNKLREV